METKAETLIFAIQEALQEAVPEAQIYHHECPENTWIHQHIPMIIFDVKNDFGNQNHTTRVVISGVLVSIYMMGKDGREAILNIRKKISTGLYKKILMSTSCEDLELSCNFHCDVKLDGTNFLATATAYNLMVMAPRNLNDDIAELVERYRNCSYISSYQDICDIIRDAHTSELCSKCGEHRKYSVGLKLYSICYSCWMANKEKDRVKKPELEPELEDIELKSLWGVWGAYVRKYFVGECWH